MFFGQINSFVVTACINREFLLFFFVLFILFHTTTEVEQQGAFFFDVVSPVGIVLDAVEIYCFTLFDLFVTLTDPNDLDRTVYLDIVFHL
jgi:hypothetical protein